jgi:hypothetical protein
MLAGDVLTLSHDGKVSRRHVARSRHAFGRDGGSCRDRRERGFVLEDEKGTITRLPELWSDSAVKMNEGGHRAKGCRARHRPSGRLIVPGRA